MLNILCSDKDDWKVKCSQQHFDRSYYNFVYADFDKLPRIKVFDLVLPLFEKDIVTLNKYYNRSNNFLIPSNKLVRFCNDKSAFNNYLIANGFSRFVPEMLNETKSFPYILKKSIDQWGENSYIIDSAEKELELLHFVNDPAYFKQKYISGEDEYTTHFIFDKNKMVYHFTLHFKFPNTLYIKGSQSPAFTTAQINPTETLYADVFEHILSAIQFSGVGCFNFKVVNGVPKIFELNPRIGGSLPLDLVNFLDAYKKTCENIETENGWLAKIRSAVLKN
ncbi:MAG: hypothetical protein ACTHJT_07660 [Cytophaga sp.]|uniref:hypothetical protein n=1 Tax=Cytophaga sp. TaxID=29535 RepID=UPI003F811920